MKKTILHFVATTPKIYSSFDRFNLELNKRLRSKKWRSVFIYCDNIYHNPIETDLKESNATIEILNTQQNLFKIFIDTFLIYLKYRPKKVHVHFENYLKAINLFLSIIFKSDYYISFRSLLTQFDKHEYINEKGLLKFILLRCFLIAIIYRSNKVFCNSMAIKNKITEFSGINFKKVFCLYVGIKDIQQTKCKNSLKKLLPEINFEKRILIANVGAFERLKGIETLVKSVFILKHIYHLNNFLVIHIGGNRTENKKNIAYNRYIFNICKKLKIDSNIFFLGEKNNVYDILPHIDLYVHPSYSEGLSQSVIEACSGGLPVIGSCTGGLPEVIHDNYNGFITKIGDEADLANRIKLLIENNELRNKMGLNSYKVFKKFFHIDHQIVKYLEMLNI